MSLGPSLFPKKHVGDQNCRSSVTAMETCGGVNDGRNVECLLLWAIGWK